MRPTAGLLAGAAAALAAAQVASPASTDCRHALDALQAEESRVIEARQRGGTPASLTPLAGLRTAAARACLGGTGQAPPPTARLLPPAEMPHATPAPAWRPPAVAVLPATPAAALPTAPSAQRPPDRPVVITHCDPAGCWANDGTWRPRVGATLGGPRGLCSTQGTLVSCP